MFDLAKTLHAMQLPEPCIIVLRHAEKTDVTPGLTDYDRGLTDNGVLQTHALAKLIASHPIPIQQIKTSPVPRCLQTAKLFQSQLLNAKTHQTTLLGNPGAYINDDQAAAAAFENHSVIEVCQMLAQHQVIDGFKSIEQGTQQLLNEMTYDLTLDGSSLYISHDVILMSFLYGLSQRTSHEIAWIDYLQGFIVTNNPTQGIQFIFNNTMTNLRELNYAD